MKIKLPTKYSNLRPVPGTDDGERLAKIYEQMFATKMPVPSEWYYEIDAPGWSKGHPDTYDARLGYLDPDGRFRFHIVDQGSYSSINFTMCFSVIMYHEGIGSSAAWHLRQDAESMKPQTQYVVFDRGRDKEIFLPENGYVPFDTGKDLLAAQKKNCERHLDEKFPGWRDDPTIGW
jgi:hypothetical protein